MSVTARFPDLLSSGPRRWMVSRVVGRQVRPDRRLRVAPALRAASSSEQITQVGALEPRHYASRRLSTQNVTPSRAAASTTKMAVSMPWKAQNLLAGW